jgi:hypothetical protein
MQDRSADSPLDEAPQRGPRADAERASAAQITRPVRRHELIPHEPTPAELADIFRPPEEPEALI